MEDAVVSMRSLVRAVFIPVGIFGIGQGAAAPIIAIVALDLGTSVWVAGLVVALMGGGLLLGDLPSGRIVSRFGERRSIAGGAAVGAVGVVLCLVAWSVWVLALGVLLSGVATSLWSLARQRYLSEVVPLAFRAQAMSTLATMWRLGALVGPFVGAGAISLVGTRGGFVVQLVAVALSGWLMQRMPDSPPGAAPAPGTPVTILAIAARYRRLYLTLGMGTLFMGAARASREAVMPLWADHLGISPAQTSLIFGIAAVLEVAVSYPAGLLMDRFGRRTIAAPSLAILAVAFVLVPLTSSVATLTAVAITLGIGNGFGNGVVMTIGADVAPESAKAEFFASWRLLHDGGMFLGPLAVAGIVVTASLASAAVTIGAAAGVGAALLWRYIPVYIPSPRGRSTDPRSAETLGNKLS